LCPSLFCLLRLLWFSVVPICAAPGSWARLARTMRRSIVRSYPSVARYLSRVAPSPGGALRPRSRGPAFRSHRASGRNPRSWPSVSTVTLGRPLHAARARCWKSCTTVCRRATWRPDLVRGAGRRRPVVDVAGGRCNLLVSVRPLAPGLPLLHPLSRRLASTSTAAATFLTAMVHRQASHD